MLMRSTVAVAVAVAVTTSALTGCTASGNGHRAPTLSEVRALLARHGTALLHHDTSGFLADVDASSSGASFRARQAAEIDNISDVPLSSWGYQVGAPVTDPTVAGAAGRRYGAAALIVRVTLSYQLAGVDLRPSTHDLWWTFVRRGDKVVVAGDDDVADAGGVSWRGPWDFGDVFVARGHSSLVLGHLENAIRLSSLAAAADAAIPAVSRVWGTDWAMRVAVLVPATPAELDALVGSHTSTDTQAVAVTDGVDPVSRQPFGQRLVVVPGALAHLSAVGEQIVVRHEVTHLASAASTGDTTPRWLVEGLAEYVGELASGQPAHTIAGELRAEITSGRVPSALPDDTEFTASTTRLAQVYQESWLACRLIAAKAGVSGLVRFYRLVGTAIAPPEQALAAAFGQLLHETQAVFVAQWRDYLRAELG